MIFRAVIRNKDHPEYGEVTIAFPIDTEDYDSDIARMEQLEIGNAVASDCYIESIDSSFPVLKCLNGRTANIDELDYLAKHLDSFDVGEAAQFQAMTRKLNLVEAKDLINLSFDCQRTTVITDFSDLNAVGRDHYMNLHGGGANKEELDSLDGEETALLLIDSGTGTITPYGVIMKTI